MNRPLYLADIAAAVDGLDAEPLRDARVLVTGATGLVGTFFTDALLALSRRDGLNLRLIALCRNIDRAKQCFPKGVEIVSADIAKETVFPDADYIVHAASNAHPAAFSADPVGTVLGNVLGVNNLLNHMKTRGGRRLLFVSTGEIYGENPSITDGFAETDFGRIDPMNPRSCYPEGKRAAETLCAAYARQYGIDAVTARLCYVYGPTITPDNSRADAQFLRKALRGEDIVMKSAGAQVRSYCYAADAARALLTVLLKGEGGTAYNVANRNSVCAIRQYAETLADIGGVRLTFDLPPESERAGYSTVTRAVQKPDRLEALGWNARFSLREGLEHTYRILKES